MGDLSFSYPLWYNHAVFDVIRGRCSSSCPLSMGFILFSTLGDSDGMRQRGTVTPLAWTDFGKLGLISVKLCLTDGQRVPTN